MIVDQFLNLNKASFNVKREAQDIRSLSVYLYPWLGITGLVFPNCPNAPNTLNWVKLNPQFMFALDQDHIRCKIKLNYFLGIPDHDP